jgi:hypothetical protein
VTPRVRRCVGLLVQRDPRVDVEAVGPVVPRRQLFDRAVRAKPLGAVARQERVDPHGDAADTRAEVESDLPVQQDQALVAVDVAR